MSICEKEIIHQLTKVLRLSVWDVVIFFDGVEPVDYVYEIETIDKKEMCFLQKKVLQKDSELSFSLTLYQALPNKLSKLEHIVQKCSEVGYAKIVFFLAERSQKLSLTPNKIQRLHTIVKEAIEQCGRNTIPQLVFNGDISDQSDIQLICHPWAQKKLSDVSLKKDATVSLYVWPEGWFSETEIEYFHQKGIYSVSLWKSILRCETVWIVTGFFLSQKV